MTRRHPAPEIAADPRRSVFSQAIANPSLSEADRQRWWRLYHPGSDRAWFATCLVADAPPGWPMPSAILVEEIADPSYRCRAADRRDADAALIQVSLAGAGCCEAGPLPPGTAMVGRLADPGLAWWFPSTARQP